MKLYVIPVETACDGKCPFCTTEFRLNTARFGNLLNVANLSKINDLNIDKIEITGGGEPFLHPRIADIITFCAASAPTQIYTHGGRLSSVSSDTLRRLFYLCVSRCHYDEDKNYSLMGIKQELELAFSLGVPIKLSLVLCRSGVSTVKDIKKYLDWADRLGAKKVVIRQLFDFNPEETSTDYQKFRAEEYVGTANLPEQLGIIDYNLDSQGNPIFMRGDMEVEVEQRTCACEANYPLLRSNGQLYLGWSDKLWSGEKLK